MGLSVREALQTVLDQVDYTSGACTPTEMVAAVLPVEVIKLAREALSAPVTLRFAGEDYVYKEIEEE